MLPSWSTPPSPNAARDSLSRDVGRDSEPTQLMPEWESEELEASLTAVGVVVSGQSPRAPPATGPLRCAKCCSWRRSALGTSSSRAFLDSSSTSRSSATTRSALCALPTTATRRFIGVYGKLALALLVCCTRYLARPEDWSEGRVRFSFWATNAKSPGTQSEKAQPQEHKARRLRDGPRNARNLIAAVGCAELEYYACERRIRGEAAEG